MAVDIFELARQVGRTMLIDICTWIWRLMISLAFLAAAYGKYHEGLNYFPPETIYDRMVASSPARHYAVIGVEVVLGLWVLSTVKPRWSSAAAGLVLLGFTVILGVEIFRRTPMFCGCGMVQVYPDGDPRVDLALGMVRNMVMMAGCGWIYMLGIKEQGKESGEKPE